MLRKCVDVLTNHGALRVYVAISFSNGMLFVSGISMSMLCHSPRNL